MMNKIILVGRTTADIALNRTQAGKDVVSFNVATDSGKRDKDKKTIDGFYRVIAYDNLAKTLAQYVKKGNEINIIGHLVQSSYTSKDGVNQNTIDIVADEINFIYGSGKNYQKVILVGNLTKEPEVVKAGQWDKSNLSIAIKTGRKDASGNELTYFYNLEAWSGLANYSKYAHKGDQILVEGTVVTNQYNNKDGKPARNDYILATNIVIYGKKNQGQAATPQQSQPQYTNQPQYQQQPQYPQQGQQYQGNPNQYAVNDNLVDDDDFPF